MWLYYFAFPKEHMRVSTAPNPRHVRIHVRKETRKQKNSLKQSQQTFTWVSYPELVHMPMWKWKLCFVWVISVDLSSRLLFLYSVAFSSSLSNCILFFFHFYFIFYFFNKFYIHLFYTVSIIPFSEVSGNLILLVIDSVDFFFFLILFIYLFIYFWLCWVFGSCEGFL